VEYCRASIRGSLTPPLAQDYVRDGALHVIRNHRSPYPYRHYNMYRYCIDQPTRY